MRLNAFPSSQRRGGCAEGADGVVGPAQYLAELTTPARQLLLSCRATPPLRGGECSALRLLSWFLCLLLLSACSVGPKYKTPAAPVPPAFKEPPPANFKENGEWKQAAPQDDSIRGDWWEIFGDPQLNDLEAQVNVSNQTIAAAEAQFRASRAAVGAARSGLFPTLTVTGSGTTTGSGAAGNRTVLGAGNVVRPGGGTFYTLPFDLTYEADVWGRVRRAIEATAATAQATAADLETIRLSVHAELALDYFELRGLDEEQRLFEQTVKGFEQALELTMDRFKQGVASAVDVEQARTVGDSTR